MTATKRKAKASPRTNIRRGVSFQGYLAIKAINASSCRVGMTSMQHMHHEITTSQAERDETFSRAKQFGRLAHMCILEPIRFEREIYIWDDARTGKEWFAYRDACGGKENVVSQEDYDRLWNMRDALKRHDHGRMLLASGSSEVVIKWRDEMYGEAKAMIDKTRGNRIYDYKTTRALGPDGETFKRDAERYGYLEQMGWYAHGYEIATGLFPIVAVIAQESRAPYAVGVFEVSHGQLREDYKTYRDVATRYHTCTKMNLFPGPCPDVMALERPSSLEGLSSLDTEGVIHSDPNLMTIEESIACGFTA